MTEFDLNVEVKRTALPTNRVSKEVHNNPVTAESYVGVFDQIITAEGRVKFEKTKANLRAVLLRENRIETLTIDEFEQNPE